nr:ribonuclease H-like domain-containing protein [Tanacetum cinerariifolium]
MAFVSSSLNNHTNSSNEAVNTAFGVTTAGTQVNAANLTNIDNLSDVVIYEFLASQSNISQLEKDGIQLTVAKLKNASKSLNKLIDIQTVDNYKKGLGYNAIPPPHTGLFMHPKLDLSYIGLEEFTSESAVETINAKTSEEVPKVVKKDNGAPIIEDWKSNDEDKSGNPQMDLQEKRAIDSGCSRHMTRNMSYLTDYQEIDRGYVSLEYSVGRTPLQNGVAERRNKTLIKAARTMLADSKLPTTFWAEAVSTACYVQNRVVVVKPHNKTLYELFYGRIPMLSFMRPFGCPVTILNTIDHLGKFDGHADERFFVGYSLNSKAFRVFNSKTKIVEETLHIRFSENTPNIVGSRPNWLFDIDALTKIVNYQLVVTGTQSNGNAGTKDNNNAGQARKEKVLGKDYILLPLWTADPPFLQEPKSSQDVGFNPSNDVVKKVNEVPRQENECKDQEEKDSVNSTNKVNAVSLTVNAASNKVNAVGRKSSIELPDDLNMPELEDISIFADSNEDVFVARIEAIRLFLACASFKDFVVYQMNVISAFLYEKIKEEVYVFQPPGFEDPDFSDKVYNVEKALYGLHQAPRACLFLKIHFKPIALLPYGIDYDEIFAPVARIEAIRLFLACASFKDFVVYQMNVKSAFLYEKIKEEVYVFQPPGFEDPDFSDKVYNVEKALYGLHQAPRACQDKYVAEILKKYEFSEVKTTSTPMETQKPLLKNEDGEEVDVFTIAMFDCDTYYSSESDCEPWPPSNLYDRFQSSGGYHVVPLSYTGTFMPPKLDLVFNTAPIPVETDHLTFNV